MERAETERIRTDIKLKSDGLTDREKETDQNRQRQIKTERDRSKQTETDQNRQRQIKTDRGR